MPKLADNVFTLSSLVKESKRTQICTVTSGKGGVGKTNLSVNMALLLKRMKKEVLLFDADIHLGNVDLFFNLRPRYTILDIVRDGKDIREVICKGPAGIEVLPASSAVMELIGCEKEVARKLRIAFAEIEHKYDYIIIDSGAGLSQNVLPFVLGADKVIVVVTRDPASIADAYGMIKIIRKQCSNMPILLVPNMVVSEEEGESIYKKLNLMTERFLNSGISFGGSIIEDPIMKETIRQQKVLVFEYPHCATVRSLQFVTRNMLRLSRESETPQTRLFERLIAHQKVMLGEGE